MRIQFPQSSANLGQHIGGKKREEVASDNLELIGGRRTENSLRRAVFRLETLLHQRDQLIQQQVVLNQELEHRLLNGLQMIASLLVLQSRRSESAETSSQLSAAADRIATIGRIHSRLHSRDGVEAFAIKQYLDDICRDFSMILSLKHPERIIVVTGIEITLRTAIAIPLGFVANELITNAIKYGTGQIGVSLESSGKEEYELSVCSDGPCLPKEFDPEDCKGLGMRIILSLVKQIGGELRFGAGYRNKGVRFAVLFS
jgi:two-component system, sensor histidine kinase PdtaS